MQQLGQEASKYITRNADKIREDIIQCQLKVQPDLMERYRDLGYEYFRRDIIYHLKFLSSALTYLSKGLFGSYIEWVKGLLVDLNVPMEDIVVNFQCFRRVFESKAPGPLRDVLVEFMDSGLSLLDVDAIEIPSFIEGDFPLSELATQYLDSLLHGNSQSANQLIQDAVKKGTDIRDIYLQVLENVQLEIGRLWHANQLTVAQEHYCTDLTRRIMDSLHSYIKPSKRLDRTLIASCVKGELHELGIRMVSDFFELSGWNTFFTGANTPTPDLIQAIKQQNADLLAISVTIPWYIIEAEKLITEIRNTKEIKDIRIIVGGRAFKLDPQLWKRIGADGFAPDAKSALEIAEG